MDKMLSILVILACLSWLGLILLPWKPWRNREVLQIPEYLSTQDLSDVTAVIPARNEAQVICHTLQALAAQGGNLCVLLVDDESEDDTTLQAQQVSGINLQVLRGEKLPAGWAGKLWALEQGIRQVRTPLVLLLDADIRLEKGVIAALKDTLQRQGCQLASVMATLHMHSFWEKLLMPSFVYFFKLLYPFNLNNSPDKRFAAAAGGCILLETRLLQAFGGLSAIRDALIDDCALARQVKQAGYRTWIGLSRLVNSIRPYANLGEIWNMVARSAFTQLRYSFVLLLLCTFLMLTLFWAPVLGLFASQPSTFWLSLAALISMATCYLPTLHFYSRSPLWVLSLPLISGFYLGMTWTSAIRYWLGERSRWKARVYSS